MRDPERQWRFPPSAWTSNLDVLVFLIGLGALIHQTHLPDPLTTPLPILTAAFAIAALWRPGSRVVQFGLMVSLIAETLWFWPYVVNHSVYLLFACSVILVSMLRMSAARDPGARDAELETHLFPALRIGIYALFAFAVLHKLNYGFFDPSVSCAVSHYEILIDRLSILPMPLWFLPSVESIGRGALILGTFAAEITIPALLFFRRTRLLGLCAAMAFHFVMGINGHQGFSGYAPAIYLAFLPMSLHERLSAHARALAQRRATSWLRLVIPIVGSALGPLILIAGLTERYYRVLQIGMVVFVLFIPALYVLFLFLTLRSTPVQRSAEMWPQAPARPLALAWVLIAALGLNSMTPYLGLSTQTSLSMYSNLRTASDEWNHLFLPQWLRIAKYQDSLVTTLVVGTTEGTLAKAAKDGDRLVPFEVRRAISIACYDRAEPLALRLALDGEISAYTDACAQRPFGGPNSLIAEKFLWFRDESPLNRCRQ